MGTRFRFPGLGEGHKFRQSSIWTAFVSDTDLKGLVSYLDKGKEHKMGQRVVQILEQMLAFEKIKHPSWGEPGAAMMAGGLPHPRFKKIAPEKYRQQEEIEKLRTSINRALAMNRFLPHASPNDDGRWNVIWWSISRNPKKLRVHRGVTELDDGLALQLILELARAGYLNRLRRCACCNKWLYAQFRHQKHCSTRCQQKHYAQSPEWKAKRRNYMREYRRQTSQALRK